MVTGTDITIPSVIFKDFVRRQLELTGLLPSQFAKKIGVSHPTVGRWLTGEDVPNTNCCRLISKFTGTPIIDIFKMTGHLPADFQEDPTYELPAFREYLMHKYPGRLHISIVNMIERELQRDR